MGIKQFLVSKGILTDDEAVVSEKGAAEAKGKGRTAVLLSSEEESGDVESSGYSANSFAGMGELATPDPKYIKEIADRIEASNLPGVDFYEFRSAVEGATKRGKPLKDAIIDSYEAFRHADKAFSVDKLISSSNHYVAIAEHLQTDFNAKSNETIRLSEQTLTSLQNDINKLLTTIGDKEAAEELGKAVADVTARRNQMTQERETKRQQKMATAVQFIVKQINSDQQAIEGALAGQ